MIYLSPEDWVEIYYAVESKMKGVSNGEYGKPRTAWTNHLKRIMLTIGADGEKAIKQGVMPKGKD